MPPSNEKSNSKQAIKLTISPTWRGKKFTISTIQVLT
jgi:hypothetical protein